MRESEFHRDLGAHRADFPPHVIVGPGDDCAVLDMPGDRYRLITTDQLIGGRHYDPESTGADLIARKALARSVSDIAAMCAEPFACVCTACFREQDAPLATEIHRAMARYGAQWGAPLVGGDFAIGSQTLLTTTVLGTVSKAAPGPILRSGAAPGDGVWVTGLIGASYETGHHLRFTPRVSAGLELRRRLQTHLHAAIDVSDGLGRDAGRVSAASGVRIELSASRLPLRDPLRSAEASLSDGEDYELFFTAAEQARLPEVLDDGTPVVRIGTVVKGSGTVLRLEDGRTVDASQSGWDHGR